MRCCYNKWPLLRPSPERSPHWLPPLSAGWQSLPVWCVIAGKSLAVVTAVFLQALLLGGIAIALLGWRPRPAGPLLLKEDHENHQKGPYPAAPARKAEPRLWRTQGVRLTG